MRPYLIALAVIALLVGSLFQAAEATGVRVMRMFGTMGIAFFGIVGSLMITRWQSRTGLGGVEKALKGLEPDCVITDWAHNTKGRPDYLVAAPGGLVAICVDETAQSVRSNKAGSRLARARARVQASAQWLMDAIGEQPGTDSASPPVGALLVLTRRQAEPEDSADGVTVVNPEELAERLAEYRAPGVLDEAARRRLTRHYRQLASG